MKELRSLLIAFAFLATVMKAQTPVACACSLAVDNPFQTNIVGTATINAACSVVYPTPSTPRCEVSGTITLDYNIPTDNWVVTQASWGLPNTNFTPSDTTLTHPSGAGVACGSPGPSSYLLIVWTDSQNSAQEALSPQKSWLCLLD